MEARFCLRRAAELPTSSSTLAPSWELNVTVPLQNLAGLPMSTRRPEPALRRPKSAVLYHCEVQLVCRLLSIANLAYWVFSLPRSFEGLVRGSKPVAPTGCSTITELGGVLWLERWWPGADPPPFGHSANAAIAARTSTLTPTMRPLANLPASGGRDSKRLRPCVQALPARPPPLRGPPLEGPSPP